ncbi:MAG TPA: hypothetical protein VM639_12465 [Dongiaceae bacterium]|nr:hypothetical protein [Dongiaceae bacterium]
MTGQSFTSHHNLFRATLRRMLTAAALTVAAAMIAAAVIAGAGVLVGAGVLAPARAADDALTVTHITADQFPILKTKASSSNFALDGAAGNAVMRSRYGTDDGTDGAKIYIFGYQLDLKAAYAVSGQNGVTAVTLDLPQAPAFATSPKLPDGTKLYVISEADGIDIASAALADGKLTFTFAAPVKPGKTPGSGDHSLWFGLISTQKPARGNLSLTTLGQSAQPPAVPSLAAGGKPADNQQPGSPVAAAGGSGIDVFLPTDETAAN